MPWLSHKGPPSCLRCPRGPAASLPWPWQRQNRDARQTPGIVGVVRHLIIQGSNQHPHHETKAIHRNEHSTILTCLSTRKDIHCIHAPGHSNPDYKAVKCMARSSFPKLSKRHFQHAKSRGSRRSHPSVRVTLPCARRKRSSSSSALLCSTEMSSRKAQEQTESEGL